MRAHFFPYFVDLWIGVAPRSVNCFCYSFSDRFRCRAIYNGSFFKYSVKVK